MKTTAFLAVFIALLGFTRSAHAVRFSGGVCKTQGSWLQTALDQAEVINNAILALQNDESCSSLVKMLSNPVQISSDEAQEAANSSFVDIHSDLAALSGFLKPGHLNTGLNDQQTRNIVYQVLLRKSNDAVAGLKGLGYYNNLKDGQKEIVNQVTSSLARYVSEAKKIAKVTMKTTQNILAAYPKSKMCLHNNPSAGLAIFTYAVDSAASLISGGEESGLSEFMGSLLNFAREMDYVNARLPMETEKFRSAVSCLVESTSESYCALKDASDALDFLKSSANAPKAEQALENAGKDPLQSPMGGLVLQLRDAPILSEWMQRVLFGIDPKIGIEATMKNDNWNSFIGYLKDVNSLRAKFNDGENMYLTSTKGADRDTKVAQILGLLNSLLQEMGVDPDDYSPGRGGNTINFFKKVKDPRLIPFYLLGKDSLPPDYNAKNNNFDNIVSKWAQNGESGFAEPDGLLRVMRTRLWALFDAAGSQANSLFNERMVVDPQDLVAEALKGPGISPYDAMVNLRTYNANLIQKFTATVKTLKTDSTQRRRMIALQGLLPLLRDTNKRLDRMIKSIESISDAISEVACPEDKMNEYGDCTDIDLSQMTQVHRDVMDVIYDSADMLVARDSFLSTRLSTILQFDITETLWKNPQISKEHSQLLMDMGSDLLSRLVSYFGTDPILERLDQSNAMLMQTANLKSVEKMFARVYFAQIQDLNCKMTGNRMACMTAQQQLDPANDSGFWASPVDWQHINDRDGGVRTKGQIVDDARELGVMKAKLCIQTLAFESREKFSGICKGALLVSEFATAQADPSGLNMSYDQSLGEVKNLQASIADFHISDARTKGVCSLRTYLRKNQIYQMYMKYVNP